MLPAYTLVTASGHEDLVHDLIKAGANVNHAQAGVLSSPLAHALKGDHMSTARALLAAGAHIDVEEFNGPVLNMIAASCAPLALTFILSHPSPPSSDHASTALLIAASVKGCTHTAAIVTSLLAAGASASAVGEFQRSALMRAAESGSSEAFQVLMRAGADVSATSADGANAFVIALMEKNEAVLQLLRPHVTAAMANPRSVAGQPALVAVASEGDLDAMLALMSHGARVSDVGEDGVSVAHALAASCAAGALEKVIEYIKEGSGGTCTLGGNSSGTGTYSCADEIKSMVNAREQQHGECLLHLHTHKHTHARTRARAHTYTHTHTHTHTHTNTHTHTHTHTHAHAHTHTHARTHTHTHKHTHTHMLKLLPSLVIFNRRFDAAACCSIFDCSRSRGRQSGAGSHERCRRKSDTGK
jgi:hypothetical protein